MQEDRVKQLVGLIDSAVNKTVIDTCVDKVYNEVISGCKTTYSRNLWSTSTSNRSKIWTSNY